MFQASDSSWIVSLSRLRRQLGMAAVWLWAASAAAAQQTASPANQPGDPGPVTIVEFLDLACPYSAQAAPGLKSLLDSYPDKVRLVVRNLPLPSHPAAPLAHAAALAAKEQGKFWEMSDLLLRNQDKLERRDLVGYARQLGLDVDRFSADLELPSIRELISEDVAEAAGLGVDATPTFFARGQRLVGADSVAGLKDLVEMVLSGNTAKAAPAITVEDSQVSGAKDAPITIVEFSDFQCPYCAQETPILRALVEEYPGQIRWVFKHFPLDTIHPASPLAHRAAVAAGQQGKFWEMHDLLFANQKNAGRDALLRAALELGLDLTRFKNDLDDDRFQAVIDRDRGEGIRVGVGGTPSFLINGELVVGIKPKSAFEAVLKDQFHLLPRIADSKGAAGGARIAAGPHGEPNEPLTLVWFSDLESPLTPPAYALVHKAMDLYPGKIRLVFKNAPLTFHGEALLAHEALLAAGAQGKFWPMHDLLLANQHALDREDFVRYASQIGLDGKKLQADLDGKTYEAAVKADLEEARVRDVRGTPTFFINGTRVDGLLPFHRLQEILEHLMGVADVR
jgi:protein-disulfide isomerase